MKWRDRSTADKLVIIFTFIVSTVATFGLLPFLLLCDYGVNGGEE